MIAPAVSVIVPVYNGAKSLSELAKRLADVLPSIASSFEVIMVDDGSRDDSVEVARRLRAQYPFVRVLRLLRNYGQHNALLCGIRHARHPFIVTLDDDLEHPPEHVASLLARLDEGYDLVYGTPSRERHGLWRDVASQTTKLVMRR